MRWQLTKYGPLQQASPGHHPADSDSHIPANLATGVCINKTITVNFSEAMDPATINTTTITLKNGRRLFREA